MADIRTTPKIEGDAVHDGADSGNPIKIGGKANVGTPSPVTDQDRVDARFDLRGALATRTVNSIGTAIGETSDEPIHVQQSGASAVTDDYVAGSASMHGAYGMVFDGTNWDRLRGDSAGGANVQGPAASDAAVAGRPLLEGGRASTAVPTPVSADGDAVFTWMNRSGAPVQTQAPHVGLNSDPWNLVHEGAQYTTTQTSAVFVAGGGTEKVVCTKIQIQVFGTNAGDLIVYFGTGAFARGTNRAIFDGTFIPSATMAPGLVDNGPFISGTNGDDILVTTTNNLNVTLSVWYYVVT